MDGFSARGRPQYPMSARYTVNPSLLEGAVNLEVYRMKKKTENLEIQPLNDDVLANLSIDELEERLELQLLHVTEAQGCWDCGTYTVVVVAPAP